MTSLAHHRRERGAETGVGSRRWDTVRTLLAGVYVLGGLSHLALAAISPGVYESFADQALVGSYTTVWNAYVVPNLGVLVPLVGLVELAIGVGLLMQDRAPKLAHGTGAAFQAGLVLSGPWGPVNGLLALVHAVGTRRAYPESIANRVRRWRGA